MIRILTLSQPWAWVVTELDKGAENRVAWKMCRYRGDVLIHAAKNTQGRADFHEACTSILDKWEVLKRQRAEFLAPVAELDGSTWEPSRDLVRSAIVGGARIVGEILPHLSAVYTDPAPPNGDRTGQPRRPLRREESRWWWGEFALALEDRFSIDPIPHSGGLGLRRAPADLVAAVARSRHVKPLRFDRSSSLGSTCGDAWGPLRCVLEPGHPARVLHTDGRTRW